MFFIMAGKPGWFAGAKPGGAPNLGAKDADVPALARATSIHFTPRKLAEIVVDGAFSAVNSAPRDQARVLDPSVGGGVFLVLSFKRLVAERWRATGERPRRAEGPSPPRIPSLADPEPYPCPDRSTSRHARLWRNSRAGPWNGWWR